MKKSTEAQGWKTVNAVRTPLGAGDFSQYLTPVLSSGADVLILNHYGKDMVNSLTQAVQFGMRQKQVNGKNFEIVVPLFSELMAQGAGEAIKGIYGTANWDWKLDNDGTKAFVKSFGKEYGTPPSQAPRRLMPRRSFMPTPANAPAPSSRPPSSRLWKTSSSTASATARRFTAAATISASRTLVVQGKEKPKDKFDLLEVKKIVPAKDVTYDPAIFGGDLGPADAKTCG